MQPSPDEIRSLIEQCAHQRGETLASLSQMIGRNDAYLQQFVRRGTPRRLPEDARLLLAYHLNVDERQLGARDPWKPGDRWPE